MLSKNRVGNTGSQKTHKEERWNFCYRETRKNWQRDRIITEITEEQETENTELKKKAQFKTKTEHKTNIISAFKRRLLYRSHTDSNVLISGDCLVL